VNPAKTADDFDGILIVPPEPNILSANWKAGQPLAINMLSVSVFEPPGAIHIALVEMALCVRVPLDFNLVLHILARIQWKKATIFSSVKVPFTCKP